MTLEVILLSCFGFCGVLNIKVFAYARAEEKREEKLISCFGKVTVQFQFQCFAAALPTTQAQNSNSIFKQT